jgi:hypothetical protein
VTRKRILLLAAAIGVGLLLLEGGVRVHHRLSTGEAFPAEAMRARLAPTADADRVLPAPAEPDAPYDGIQVETKVLHPFLGYVSDRGEAPGINRFGFPGVDPLVPPAPGVVRVALAGGSVALQLYGTNGGVLGSALGREPAFAGKRIEVVALALGGYKQPQQLMALAWLLSLGAHFDVVVNLDGFNELVLPYADNAPVGIHPGYPRSWQLYQSSALDAGEALYLTDVRDLRAQQQAWRIRLGTGLPSRSAFTLALLDRIDARIEGRVGARDAAFRADRNRAGLGFQATGPYLPYPDENALFDDCVAIWQASSRAMHQLATGAGARYFHFLQPNQWVPDGKPWSGIERSQLRVPGRFAPRKVVRAAYPKLLEAGSALAREGVAFTSLVHLFRNEERTVYRDTCCHFNPLGVQGLAEAVARTVGEGLLAAAPGEGASDRASDRGRAEKTHAP